MLSTSFEDRFVDHVQDGHGRTQASDDDQKQSDEVDSFKQ
jgi:hypothetical protein